MATRLGSNNEAELHWCATMVEYQQAVEHALATELTGKTVAVRRSAGRKVQKFNRAIASLREHHPVLCGCRADAAEIQAAADRLAAWAAA